MNYNTIKRTIMIFPEFKDIDIIDRIREKYDPLANHVRPHITLVFSFDSNITSDELNEHLRSVLQYIKPFELTMEEIIKIDNSLGMYLFLTVTEGKEEIKRLSVKLYNGILEAYKPIWFGPSTFLPHMTIGNFNDKNALNAAFEDVKNIKDSFTTIVDTVSVEIIDENEDSIIEMNIDLTTTFNLS